MTGHAASPRTEPTAPRAARRLIDVLLAPSRTTLRRLAAATLVANILLVVTGGAVRLTDSGLGCPTWPRCTADSFVSHRALGINGYIEFGNRMLTFVLTAIAVATFVAAMRLRPARAPIRWLAGLLLFAIPVQAVIGGISVLTDLNPWVVSFHLLTSLAMVGVAVLLLHRLDELDRPATPTVPPAVGWLTRGLFVVTWAVLYAGTIVTGSGPHAGSADAPRNGLSPSAVSQLHADLVFLLIGLSAGVLIAFWAAPDTPDRARRAALWLVVIELAQGLIGFVQYFTGLPIVLVGFHMFGAALISAAATWVVLGTRERGRQPA